MTAIKLPSPPVPVRGFFGALQRGYIVPITETDLRARDLEVAKLVLEAAAQECEAMWGGRSSMSEVIRALEFKHE